MRGIARRLGRNGGKIELFRQFTRGLHGLERRDDLADEMTVGIHAPGIAESAPFVIR